MSDSVGPMSTVNGLPAHILLNHLIVVLGPLTAILAIICALWPAARQRLIWLVLLLAVITLVLTPVTASAGVVVERSAGNQSVAHTHQSRATRRNPRLRRGGAAGRCRGAGRRPHSAGNADVRSNSVCTQWSGCWLSPPPWPRWCRPTASAIRVREPPGGTWRRPPGDQPPNVVPPRGDPASL